jgi:amidase
VYIGRENTARLPEDMGHLLEETQPDIDGIALAESDMALYFCEIAADIDELERVLGRKAAPNDVESTTWTLALLGISYSSGYMVRAIRQWELAARKMGYLFKELEMRRRFLTFKKGCRSGNLMIIIPIWSKGTTYEMALYSFLTNASYHKVWSDIFLNWTGQC